MKLLLYCTKIRPYLNDYRLFRNQFFTMKAPYNARNGKIVAECDFEVEEIGSYDYVLGTETLDENNLLERSCLSLKDIIDYLKPEKCSLNNGYAIHIKNLNIFDDPKYLSDYYTFYGVFNNIKSWKSIDKAPQNMMYAYKKDGIWLTDKSVLISIHPEHLCKILNGEKTIEIRKKVLKEML